MGKINSIERRIAEVNAELKELMERKNILELHKKNLEEQLEMVKSERFKEVSTRLGQEILSGFDREDIREVLSYNESEMNEWVANWSKGFMEEGFAEEDFACDCGCPFGCECDEPEAGIEDDIEEVLKEILPGVSVKGFVVRI